MDDEFLQNLVRGIGMATGLGRGWRGNIRRSVRGGVGRSGSGSGFSGAWHTRAERSDRRRKSLKDQATNYVRNILVKWHVVIFVSSACQDCEECVKICEKAKQKPFCVEVDLCYNSKQVEEVLEELSSKSTNLRIFVNEQFIGGLQELIECRDSRDLFFKPDETDV